MVAEEKHERLREARLNDAAVGRTVNVDAGLAPSIVVAELRRCRPAKRVTEYADARQVEPPGQRAGRSVFNRSSRSRTNDMSAVHAVITLPIQRSCSAPCSSAQCSGLFSGVRLSTRPSGNATRLVRYGASKPTTT